MIQLKNKLINSIILAMKPFLNENQIVELNNTLINTLELKYIKKIKIYHSQIPKKIMIY